MIAPFLAAGVDVDLIAQRPSNDAGPVEILPDELGELRARVGNERGLRVGIGFYAGWPKMAHAMARFTHILQEPGNGWVAKRKAKEETT